MSTILDALRKAEEKRARGSVPAGITKGREAAARFVRLRTLAFIIILFLLGAACAALSLTWWIRRDLDGEGGKRAVREKRAPGTESGSPAAAPERPAQERDGATDALPTVSLVPALSAPAPSPEKADAGESALPDLHLSGVLWDERRPLAIVNGELLTEGEEIAGAKVVAIDLDGVRLLYQGKVHTLNVR